jgi:hypothetical protein
VRRSVLNLCHYTLVCFMRRFWLRLSSWLIPTLVTGAIALLAAGMRVEFTTNHQDLSNLHEEIRRARADFKKVEEERRRLNDRLWSEKAKNKTK